MTRCCMHHADALPIPRAFKMHIRDANTHYIFNNFNTNLFLDMCGVLLLKKEHCMRGYLMPAYVQTSIYGFLICASPIL